MCALYCIGGQRCGVKQHWRVGSFFPLEASHHEQPLPADPQSRVQRRADGRGRAVQRGLSAVLRAAAAEGVSPGAGEDDPQDQADDPGQANVEEGVQDGAVQPDSRLLQDRVSNGRRVQGR